MTLLSAAIKEAGYGAKIVLGEVTISLGHGEILGVIGPNGSGKSTLLKALAGIVSMRGTTYFDGESLTGWPADRRVRAGISFVPQGHRVFEDLTIAENLVLGGHLLTGPEAASRREQVLEWFPVLKERFKEAAFKLSGGEKQQLALGRALMLTPRLMLLDEPSLGLAPGLTAALFERLQLVSKELKIALIIAEQKVHDVLSISDQMLALRLGRAFASGTSTDIGRDEVLRRLFSL